MKFPDRSELTNYAIAVGAVAAVVGIRFLMDALGWVQAPFLLLALAPVLAAWFGGFGPGLLATVLTTVAADYLFLPPYYEFAVTAHMLAELSLFFAQGVGISVLGGARRKAFGALKEARDELEVRVDERTSELRQANVALEGQVTENQRVADELRLFSEELQRSNRELQDFASVASHDLQEPLRKIRAFGDRLWTKCGESLNDEGRDYLQRMLAAAGRMQVLIEDLLTFSRVTTRAQPFERIDLNLLLSEVVSDLEVRLAKTGGRVEIGELPTLDADPTQMRQLFQNLLSNALKFHKPGVPPLVRVEGRRLDGQENGQDGQGREFCEIQIADNGIGFDEKYVDRIFNIFQRLHGRNTYEGTGIGLAVCRKIVERHGGTITAQSAPEQGATFIVHLPLEHPQLELSTDLFTSTTQEEVS